MMNLIKKLPIALIILIISCSHSIPKKATDITFNDYLKSLDTIPLPLEHSCSLFPFPKISTHFDSTGFKKYRDANCAMPLGILFNNGKHIITIDLSIADDCLAPVISSFDKFGRKLDSLDLYEAAGGDTTSEIMPYFKIDKNRRIMVVDTVKKWKNDKYSNIIAGSEVITIDSTIYYLSKNGKFVKEK